MMIVAVPNVSEGRDRSVIAAWTAIVEAQGARVLDVHSDGVHNRSVLTVAGTPEVVPLAMAELAACASSIDLVAQRGAHPRLGGLDVCPVVADRIPMETAVESAKRVGAAIAERARLPVYLYGAAATRVGNRDLPALRKGGLAALEARARWGLAPDFGPPIIDPHRGVVCVGARGPLIAFNVWLRCGIQPARRLAAQVRASGGGLPGTRALGIEMGGGLSQVSMNLIEPDTTGVDAAFAAVAEPAAAEGIEVVATEIVGLAPERYLPDPQKRAARLLLRPGRSLESALRDPS